jgi:heme-degrading monooxygenase HmoA
MAIPMAIIRIFRVRIAPVFIHEFEEKFSSLSIDAVNKAQGFLEASIHKPTKWAPDEYAMISLWENEAALESFAGEQWRQAVIPPEMEKYVLGWEVHHYEAW